MISDKPCPISFLPGGEEKILYDASEWKEGTEILTTIRDFLGIDQEGGTEPDSFEHANSMNKCCRLEMLNNSNEHESEHEREVCWKNWPYKDDSDDSPPPPL